MRSVFIGSLSRATPRVYLWPVGAILCLIFGWCSAAHALELTLHGVAVRTPNRVSNEVFARLTLPLDEWFSPKLGISRLSRRHPVLAEAWNTTETFEAHARRFAPVVDVSGFAQGAADSGVSDMNQAPGRVPTSNPTPVVRSPALPRVDAPFLRGLMQACGREFGPTRVELSDLASRARYSAWLPEIQVKGGRNTDETLRLTPTEAEPDRYQLVGGDGVRFEGQIKWSFNQLVFARDELAVARLQGALETEKRRREQRVMDVLGKWLRARVTLGDVNQPSEKRVNAWVDERALRAELDWLSQGWFSRHVEKAPELDAVVGAEWSQDSG